MEENNKLALIAAYYLSRFDQTAYEKLGYGGMRHTHEAIGSILNINKNTIKNMRDEFDSIHNNPRRGWYQRELRPSRKSVVNQYSSYTEKELYKKVCSILNINNKETKFVQGGDAQAIRDVAIEYYGGYENMFKVNGWDERGEKMLPSVGRNVSRKYGSVQNFINKHLSKGHIFDGKSVYLTSYYGWSPEGWGMVGFSQKGRLDTLIKETTNPFYMVIYVTMGAPTDDIELKGKVVGFYEISHQKGHRDEFLHPTRHNYHPEKWIHGLKALRAFTFLPEYQMHINEFYPEINRENIAQRVSGQSIKIPDEKIDVLKSLPYYEVDVYKGQKKISERIETSSLQQFSGRNKVGGGASNSSGYYVDAEPKDAPKELYVFELTGGAGNFLGRESFQKKIYKIGLSMSPKTRLSVFNKALPNGRFSWKIKYSTKKDGDLPYLGFEVAEYGENAMKDYLALSGEWLGGEFYATTEKVIKEVWQVGKKQALLYQESNQK